MIANDIFVNSDMMTSTTKVSTRSTPPDSPTTEHERLGTLLHIGEALSSTLNAKAGFQEVLEILGRRHAIARSLIVLMDEDAKQLHVEAAHGLNRPSHHIHYTLGEGVIGKVVESGRAVIVPRVTKEPTLVFRAAGRDDAHEEESSFICVPIGFDRKVVGALGVNLKFKPDRNFERSRAFFSVVASMIGQALKVQRLIAAQHRRLVNENAHLRQELKERYDFAGIVGNSGPMQRVYEQVAQVARTGTTVLLRGESGTGKELIAHAIHYNSARAKKPFVKVSCGALPDTLIESELFGYEKGAFTGAMQRRQGRFELANDGTIFLDEIGELPAETQIALLRVIQERQFERVGGSRGIPTDVRIIAATNRDLAAAIAAGTFRADLFYRLNVFPINVPPLRQRKEDIPMLVEYFVKRYADKARKQISKIDKNTLELCQSYHWPGNIRELQNIIERSVILCTGDTLWIDEAWLSSQNARLDSSSPLKQNLQNYEKELIEAALAESNGKVAGPDGAAAKLGIPRSTLDLKIKQLKIKKPTIR